MLHPTQADPIDAVARYAARFHGALGDVHTIASPLGAWLLLAAVAPLAEGPVRAELEDALGCPAGEAAALLAALLATPHPAVAPALAIWTKPRWTAELRAALAEIRCPGIETGPIPDQAAADAWARESTRGVVEEFPIVLNPLTVCLIASGLGTHAPWVEEFGYTDASRLAPSCWGSSISTVLNDFHRGDEVIFSTRSAGLVAGFPRETTNGLLVVPVIAAPEVPVREAIAAAHEVASHLSGQRSSAAPCSLFDLPLGRGHSWEITEEEIAAETEGARVQFANVALPAWEAASPELDLLADSRLGFGAALAALTAKLPPIPEGYLWQAVQAARARFNRFGFSAGAVSVAVVECGAAMGHAVDNPPKGLLRTARVGFSRPFAVVAVARGVVGETPWAGVPVFSAWVREAIDTPRSLAGSGW